MQAKCVHAAMRNRNATNATNDISKQKTPSTKGGSFTAKIKAKVKATKAKAAKAKAAKVKATKAKAAKAKAAKAKAAKAKAKINAAH
jgi:hypothetical protein